MAIRDNLTFTRQDKRLVIGGAVLLLLAMVLFLTLPALVDTQYIEREIKTSFKKVTGLDLEIQDGMEVRIFPTPHIVIHNLYVTNVPGAATSFMLAIRTMDVRMHTTSLLSARPTASSVTLDGVVVELEKLKNGRMNWREMAQYLATNAKKDNAEPADSGEETGEDNMALVVNALSIVSSVTVTNADMHFTDSQAGIVTNYSDISVNFTNSKRNKESRLEVSVNYGYLPFSFTAELGEVGESYAAKSTAAKLRLESNQTIMEYEGEIAFQKSLALKGKSSFDSKDVAQWIRLLNEAGQGDDKNAAKLKQVPLRLESEVTTEGKSIMLPSIAVTGGVLGGTLQAEFNSELACEIRGKLDSVNLDTVFASGMFPGTKKSGDKKDKKDDENDEDASSILKMMPKKSLWSYLTFSVNVKAEEMSFNHGHIKNAHIEFDMSDGDMTISQISGAFPGESKLLFTGLAKEGYQGFMIDGQLDGAGENFVEMISLFKRENSDLLLPLEFKRFRWKTNMVLSAQELRFSELTARVENTAFVGSIIATFGDKPKIQSAMRIGGVDMDRFLSIWGVNKFRDDLMAERFVEGQAESPITQWLRDISYEVDARLSLEQYTLNGRLRDKCKFRTSIIKNKITFTEVEMTLGDTQIAGRTLLDVTEKLPFFEVDMSADMVDLTEYLGQNSLLFDPVDANTAKNPGKNWSHRGLFFHWLDHVNAKFRIKVGLIKNGDFEVNSIDTRGGIEERTISFPAFSAQIQGSQLTGKGFIKGGKIPSASATGDLNGIDVGNLIGFMPALQGMSGRYNTHFNLNTSGIDVFTWLYNLEGNIAIAARDITIDGFNLPAIISAVGYVRTVADILDAVKRAYPGGSTIFNYIDGEWTVGNGVFKATTLRLRNEFSEGEFAGQVDFINWKMVGHLVLALTYLDRATPPKMSINYSGNLDNVEKELDTRLLEQYVANRTAEKLLHQNE